MDTALLTKFPDSSILISAGGSLQTEIEDVSKWVTALQTGEASSPIAGLFTAFSGLQDKAQIDISPLTQQIPAAIQSIQNALAENTIQALENINQSYTSINNLLKENSLAREIPGGFTLEDIALAVISDARTLLDDKVNELTAKLIDPQALAQLQAFYQAFEQFETNFPTSQDQFLPFLTNYLIGVAPDLLEAPLAKINESLAFFAPLQETQVASQFNPVRQALMTAYLALKAAIEELDPTDPQGYAEIQLRLDQLQSAGELMFSTLRIFYQTVENLIESPAWDLIFSAYVTIIDAIAIERVFTVDDLTAAMGQVLESLLARVYDAFEVDDLRQGLESLTQTIRDAVISSPLGQIQPTLTAQLETVSQAIESIPTEGVQIAVSDIFKNIQRQLDELGLEQIQAKISQAFQDLEGYIVRNINEGLKTEIEDGLNTLLSQVKDLPVADLIAKLTNALQELQKIIQDLQAALDAQVQKLEELLSQLEQLSATAFQPVGDVVIGEIDDLRQRLEAINPNALSETEKLAIKAALAILESIDLQGKLVKELKAAYDQAEANLRDLLEQIIAGLHRFTDQFDEFNPEKLLKPADDLLEQAAMLVQGLNGRNLLGGLYSQLEELNSSLQELSPGRLLDPLQPGYDAITATIERLNPAQWVSALEDVYSQIDGLIDKIDITPVLERLDGLQRELLNKVRDAILQGLEDLNLPEPLKGFFDDLRPLFELVTEAIFGDPDVELRKISLQIKDRVTPTQLFVPLDAAYLRLVNLLNDIPADKLTEVMNAIRVAIGGGMQILNPANMMAGMWAIADQFTYLAPAYLLTPSFDLATIEIGFEAKASIAPADRQVDILAVSAKMEAVFTVFNPRIGGGQMRLLESAHADALQALEARIRQLDNSTASQSYARLNRAIVRLTPDFLLQADAFNRSSDAFYRSAEPLTHAQIMAGIAAMKPSSKAQPFANALNHFLDRLQPMEAALEPSVNQFFATLREILSLLNPFVIKETVAQVYAAIHAKIRVIDPQKLKSDIQGILTTATAPLQALNPAQIKNQINGVYRSVLEALSNQVRAILDAILKVVDDQLRAIRVALKDLLDKIKQVIITISKGIQDAIDQVEGLVFVSILDRLKRVLDNLGMSFDQELDRVVVAFDEMLAAIPV